MRNLERGEEKGGNSLDCICSASIFIKYYLRTLTRARVAGNFGLRGQETVRNIGARDPDRLFLAGWEVNQFWEELQNNISLRYLSSLLCCVNYCYIVHYFFYAEYAIHYYAAKF